MSKEELNNENQEQPAERYYYAPEPVRELMARLVDKYHGHLAEAKISLVMRNGKWQKRGEDVEADAQLVTGVNQFETGANFRIMINAEFWEQADEKRRSYILDNQLARCSKDVTDSGEVRWYVRDYAVKAFPAIIERYGLITEPIRKLQKVMAQQSLFEVHEGGLKATGTEG